MRPQIANDAPSRAKSEAIARPKPLPAPETTTAFPLKRSGLKTVAQLREERSKANPSGRFGDPAEFGDACAYLCSAQAGYITGQNMLLDGGAFPGTF